jgi:hypothetical protein
LELQKELQAEIEELKASLWIEGVPQGGGDV